MRWWKVFLSILAGIIAIVGIGPFLIPVPPLADVVDPQSLGDPDSQFIELNGLKVHLKESGQGQPAIILLHGFGASLFSWREVMQPLSHQAQVIAYDRPAFGLTERPLTWQGINPYSTEAQADLLIALLDHFKIQKAVLVGNSAGGTVAVLAALKYPERVQALVLVDAAIYQGGGLPGWVKLLAGLPQVQRLGPLLVRQIATSGDDTIRSAWHDPSQITQAVLAGYHKPLQSRDWDRALWQFSLASQPLNLPSRLSEIKVPTLVITGDDDRIVPTDLSLRLAKEIPGAQLRVISNSGHLPQEEKPEEFLQAVQTFLHKKVAGNE